MQKTALDYAKERPERTDIINRLESLDRPLTPHIPKEYADWLFDN